MLFQNSEDDRETNRGKTLTLPSKRSSKVILVSVNPMTSDPWTKSSSSDLGSVLKISALFFELMMAV